MSEYIDSMSAEDKNRKHFVLLPNGKLQNGFCIHDISPVVTEGKKYVIKIVCLLKTYTFKSKNKRDIDALWENIIKAMP